MATPDYTEAHFHAGQDAMAKMNHDSRNAAALMPNAQAALTAALLAGSQPLAAALPNGMRQVAPLGLGATLLPFIGQANNGAQ